MGGDDDDDDESYGCVGKRLYRDFKTREILNQQQVGFLRSFCSFVWSLSFFFLIQFKDDNEERRKKARDLEIGFFLYLSFSISPRMKQALCSV